MPDREQLERLLTECSTQLRAARDQGDLSEELRLEKWLDRLIGLWERAEPGKHRADA